MKLHQRISVHDLVSHLLARGDLVYGFRGSGRLIRAIRAHQKVQKQRPKGYQPEVSVGHIVKSNLIDLEIGGRIDGVWPTADGIVIEEIKTTTQSIEEIAQTENPVHWGQLKCYAFMYATVNELDLLQGQLTYYHLDTGETVEIRKDFDLKGLAKFFSDLISRYLDWAETIARWHTRRNDSIQHIDFPFVHYRPGQRQMAVSVYRTIRDGNCLMVQAATGIGKTMAVLFPAIKALGENLTGTLFYLTARTTGRMAAEEALSQMRQKKLVVKSLVITAKDKICFEPEAACNPDLCPFAKGFYDRITAAVETAFKHDALDRAAITAIARHDTVCPFALSLIMAQHVDVVIGDYNYVFDPRVALRNWLDAPDQPHTLLVDEAHNLVDRSREMFSAVLCKQLFLTVRRKFKQDLPELHQLMGRINRWFLNVRKIGSDLKTPQIESAAPSGLSSLLRQFIQLTDRWLALNKKTPYREPLLELFFTVANFIRVHENYDGHYRTCYEPTVDDFRVTLYCIDPSPQLGVRLEAAAATIFFSATMTPMDYFSDLFGVGQDTARLDIPSPFPSKNRCVIVCPYISTRLRRREKTRPQVISALRTLLDTIPGNYLFYFPSHQYMQAVHADFKENYQNVDLIIQGINMTEEEREWFIEHFSPSKKRSRIGFAVMGGIFGEGIDLPGDCLKGVVVAGVGLPAISWQNELIREYYQLNANCGFEYSYIYPGINRVRQAAGRVIRSETDTGVILLIDDRFDQPPYRYLLPKEWHLFKALNTKELRRWLLKFETKKPC